MRKLLYVLVFLLSFSSYAQNFKEYDSKTFNFLYPEEYYVSERRVTSAKFEIKLLSRATDIYGGQVATFTMNSVASNSQIEKTFYDDNHWKTALDNPQNPGGGKPNNSYNYTFERIKMYGKDFIKITHEQSSPSRNFHGANFVFIDNNRLCTSTIGADSKKDLENAIKDLSIIYRTIYHK